MQEEITVSNNVVLWAIGVVMTGFIALLGYIWRRHNEEITEIKQSLRETVPLQVYERNRIEMRENVMKIHEKIENNDKRAQERHDNVMDAILSLKAGR